MSSAVERRLQVAAAPVELQLDRAVLQLLVDVHDRVFERRGRVGDRRVVGRSQEHAAALRGERSGHAGQRGQQGQSGGWRGSADASARLIIRRPIIDARWVLDTGARARLRLAAAGFCLAVGFAPARLSAQTAPAPVCDITTAERVVAVGDVHGAYDSFVAILRAAGLIDSRDRWAGGRAIFIQTGDVLDRGNDSRRVAGSAAPPGARRPARRRAGAAAARESRADARAGRLALRQRRRAAGVSQRRLRRAARAGLRKHRGSEPRTERRPRRCRSTSGAFREQFLKEVPLGFIEMRQAFDAKGEYGRLDACPAHHGDGQRHRVSPRRRQRRRSRPSGVPASTRR